MKRFAIAIFLFSIAATVAIAQDEDPDKAMKKASRQVSNYTLDPSANSEKLDEAKTLIDGAMASGELDGESKAWYTYGTVYAELLNRNVMQLVDNADAPIMVGDAPSKIYEGFSKAYDTAEKKFEKRDAVTGMTGIMNNVAYVASVFLGRSEFSDAYSAYESLINSHDFLTKNQEESIFETEEEFQQQIYWGALAAYSGGDLESAEKMFVRLYEEEYDSPDIYSALVDISTAKGDTEAARKYIDEGIEKYPEDKGLLYSEINRALAAGELESLIGKLEKAETTEPDNVTIPSTLGHVYDQLYQGAVAEGDMDKANMYYENAQKAFQRALAIDEEYFDAIYMLGALEYNKAAQLAIEVNELAEDYSKEGTKKYEQKKGEMMGQFDLALPFFVKAEQLRPDDVNTLIALREIYARKDQLDKSNEYKQKIESLPPAN